MIGYYLFGASFFFDFVYELSYNLLFILFLVSWGFDKHVAANISRTRNRVIQKTKRYKIMFTQSEHIVPIFN